MFGYRPAISKYLLLLIGAAGLAIGVSIPVNAQEGSFADDFSSNSLRYSLNQPDFSVGVANAVTISEGLLFSIENNVGSGQSFIHFSDNVFTDSLTTTFVPRLEATSLDENAIWEFRVDAALGNTVAEGAEFGDVLIGLNVFLDAAGNTFGGICMDLNSEDGREPLNIFQGNSSQCTGFQDFSDEVTVSYDQPNSIGFAVDRANSSVSATVNGSELTFTLPFEELFIPTDSGRILTPVVQNGIGNTEILITSIRGDDGTVDFASNPPVIDRYRQFAESGATLQLQNEQLVFNLPSLPENEDFLDAGLLVNDITDYFEAELSFSSDTIVSTPEQRASMQMDAIFFNQFNDGIAGDYTGDVEGRINFAFRADGQRGVEICLVRFEDPDRNNRTGLLDDSGRECDSLPIFLEEDTIYRTSVSLDRDAGEFNFIVNGVTRSVPVELNFFAAGNPSSRIAFYSRLGGVVAGTVDNVRTSPAALTLTESSSGLEAPLPFPEQTAVPTGDSNLLNPLPSEPVALNFIDDFSTPVETFVFEANEDRGDAGVLILNDGVQFEAAASDPDECCPNTRIRVSEDTDFLSARVSLSSESSIGLTENDRATVRIAGVFYNDTMDGGFDGRTGDVFIQNRIQVRGNGRRRAEVCVFREFEGGGGEEVNMFDGNSCAMFSIVPDFDTIYDLSIRLDRDENSLTVSLDDETITTPLLTEAFQPSRNTRAYEVQHQGTGRAIGRIHSVSTETASQDFSIDTPIFPPYRGLRDTEEEGVDASVFDGRLNIELDASVDDDGQKQFRYVSRNPNDFISATINLSSSSDSSGGELELGVGGHMYNDIQDGGLAQDDDGNNEGSVFAILRLIANDDDGGGDHFEYCAFRSNTDNFSSSIELVTNVEDANSCARLDMQPQMDTDYQLVIELDRENSMLVYSVDDVTVSYSISTGIFEPSNFFQGIRATANGTSQLTGTADNLAFSANPVPLIESATLIGLVATDVVADAETDNGTDAETDVGNDAETDVVADAETDVLDDADSGGDTSTSGGGGLVSYLVLFILGMFNLPILRRRRVT